MEAAARTKPIPIAILFRAKPTAVPMARPNPKPFANLFDFFKTNL